jgi:hypothetical protein
MAVLLKLDDLLEALEWVSGDGTFEHAAYVSRENGRVYWLMDESALDGEEDELPSDLDDEDKYVSVPHKRDLDLGRRLVLRFTEEHLPAEIDRVLRYFSKAGAYSRFKDMLAELGQLDAWHAYEETAVVRAMRVWAADNGFEVTEDTSAEG